MKRLCVLLCALAFCGCASDGSKHWYDDALDDWNGKNMQMRNDFAGPSTAPIKKSSD
jgi:hypothetical protein